MTTINPIIAQLSAAVAARKDSLADLRGRIVDLLDPIPIGVVLSDDAGEVCRIIRVCTGASQWSNRSWEVTIRGSGVISAAGKLICEDLESSKWDGNNMHTRDGEPTCRWSSDEVGDKLNYEPGSRTREIAARLPAAIARYMALCEQERSANTATAF